MTFGSASVDRFWSRVRTGPDCWEWTGAKNHGGYGVQHMDGRQWRAPRIAYVLSRGPIAPEQQIDHLCFNRGCVNPNHLETVTPRVNSQRAVARKTVCAQGHPWTSENIMLDKRGWRRCRVCHNSRAHRSPR